MILIVTVVSVAKNKQGKYWSPEQAPRTEAMPSMDFVSGTLYRNSIHGWTIGEIDILFTRNSILTSPDQPGENIPPSSGLEVMLTGQRLGNSLVVHSGRVTSNTVSTDFETEPPEIEWSEVDSDVGWGKAPM
ncbi:MAG: hypothetical protein ABIF77_05590 [bacterium]